MGCQWVFYVSDCSRYGFRNFYFAFSGQQIFRSVHWRVVVADLLTGVYTRVETTYSTRLVRRLNSELYPLETLRVTWSNYTHPFRRKTGQNSPPAYLSPDRRYRCIREIVLTRDICIPVQIVNLSVGTIEHCVVTITSEIKIYFEKKNNARRFVDHNFFWPTLGNDSKTCHCRILQDLYVLKRSLRMTWKNAQVKINQFYYKLLK